MTSSGTARDDDGAPGAAGNPAASQFVRFVAVSGIAAAANFGSRIVFSLFAPFPVAIALAFCVGLSAAFLLNRTFVFTGSTNSTQRQAAYFVLVNLAGLAQTLLVTLALAHLLRRVGVTLYVEELAHAAGIAVPIVSSYFGHKYLSFRQH